MKIKKSAMLGAAFVAMTCVAVLTPAAAEIQPFEAGTRAMGAGQYQLALEQFTLARKECKGCGLYAQAQADALFMLGRRDEAFKVYAQTLRDEIKDAYSETKGTSAFWKGLGVAMMAAGAYVDYQNAQSGIMSSQMMTTAEQVASIETKEAVGDKDYRKAAKTAIADLQSLSKKPSATVFVVHPAHNFVPGAAMARVMINGGNVCNAVRIGAGSYATSGRCLLSHAADPGSSPMVIKLGPGLRPAEEAQVASAQPANTNDRGGAWILRAASSDLPVAKDSWSARTSALKSGDSAIIEYAVTWYGPDLAYTAPQFQSCGTRGFQGCPDAGGEHEILWVRTGAGWSANGFAAPDNIHLAN